MTGGLSTVLFSSFDVTFGGKIKTCKFLICVIVSFSDKTICINHLVYVYTTNRRLIRIPDKIPSRHNPLGQNPLRTKSPPKIISSEQNHLINVSLRTTYCIKKKRRITSEGLRGFFRRGFCPVTTYSDHCPPFRHVPKCTTRNAPRRLSSRSPTLRKWSAIFLPQASKQISHATTSKTE